MNIQKTQTSFGMKKWPSTNNIEKIFEKAKPFEIDSNALKEFSTQIKKIMQEAKLKEIESIKSASKVILNA